MLRRFSALTTSILVAIGLLSACTPEQLKSYEKVTGTNFTSEETQLLLGLPDVPMRVDARTIVNPDGTITSFANDIDAVNALPYSANVAEPFLEAFRIVTAARGWSAERTASWEAAALDIAGKESRFCWNVRYGARFAYYDGSGCVLSRAGHGDASGFGQVTNVERDITCQRADVCSIADTIASPWNSMSAMVAIIEANGVSPWCYDSFSRRFHRPACQNPGLSF